MMTPFQIIDDEICTKFQGVKFYHKSFQDALFRPEETASAFDKTYDILVDIRVRTAKQLLQEQITQIRLLQMIKGRMQHAAKEARKSRRVRRALGLC